MKIKCNTCGKPCSNEIEGEIILSGIVECPECTKANPMYMDRRRMNFLQDMNRRNLYSGRCMMRYSTMGRGWRLHETTNKDGSHSVRKAIDRFMSLNEKLCWICQLPGPDSTMETRVSTPGGGRAIPTKTVKVHRACVEVDRPKP